MFSRILKTDRNQILTVSLLVLTSVPDPRRFDADPDSRIRSSGLRIRIRILFLAGGGGLDWH